MLPSSSENGQGDEEDILGECAETSNYQCCDSCDHPSSATPDTLGDNQQVMGSCRHQHNHSPKNRYSTDFHQGGPKVSKNSNSKPTKRSKDGGGSGSVSLSSWEIEERQNIANVMNGESRVELDSSEEDSATRARRHSPLNQPEHQETGEDVFLDEKSKCQSSKILQSNNNLSKDPETSNGTPRAKKKSSLKKGRPKSVGDLLHRINLDVSESSF